MEASMIKVQNMALPAQFGENELRAAASKKLRVPADRIEAIELSIKALKEAMEKDDPERIRARSQDLTEAAMKLGEAIYKSQQEADAASAGTEAGPSGSTDDDVVDADFEDLGEDKKKS